MRIAAPLLEVIAKTGTKSLLSCHDLPDPGTANTRLLLLEGILELALIQFDTLHANHAR